MRQQLLRLVESYRSRPFTEFQIQLIEGELCGEHIHESDVESAVRSLVYQKRGNQPLPSVDEVCSEVELQRERRLNAERIIAEKHVLERAANSIPNELYKVHAKATVAKFKQGVKTAREPGSEEAKSFEKICKELVRTAKFESLTKSDFNQFMANVPPTLEVEYAIVAKCARERIEEYDPFQEV